MSDFSKGYFNWLYDQVFDKRDINSGNSFAILCDYMHRMPFRASVPHDENRIKDGEELRHEYLGLRGATVEDAETLRRRIPDASVLEVLIALARRAEFMGGQTVSYWFDEFLRNLNLGRFKDRVYRPQDAFKIERILGKFNDRRYAPDGRGGLFPLKVPNHDQREVELWYQMAAYMTENHTY